MAQKQVYLGLDPLRFGVAAGIFYAVIILLLGLVASFYGIGTVVVATVSNYHIGYSATFGGSIIGAIWAFIYGLIAGAFFAYIYNLLLK